MHPMPNRGVTIDRIDTYAQRWRPLLKDGKLDMRATVAYGPKGSHLYVASVYVFSVPKGAGSRGGDPDRAVKADALLLRTTFGVTTPEDEQVSLLQTFLDIASARLGMDYVLRSPLAPKPARSHAWLQEEAIRKLRKQSWLHGTKNVEWQPLALSPATQQQLQELAQLLKEYKDGI